MLPGMKERETARDAFGNHGYKMLKDKTLERLHNLLGAYVEEAHEAVKLSFDWVRISDQYDIKYNQDGNVTEAYFYMDSDYFKGREAVSFNQDGFVGFAGWAADNNVTPITNAFMKWVEYLKKLDSMKTFRVNDEDVVAALSEEEARDYYMKDCSISKEELDEYYIGRTDELKNKMFFPVKYISGYKPSLFVETKEWGGEDCVLVSYKWAIQQNGDIDPYILCTSEF